MSAFQRCVELGYSYLETDVHATVDGVLLAFHDARLDRITDRTGRVARLPYREVAQARIGGVEPIPRLEELLGSWPQVRVNVDVKAATALAPLVRVLQRTRAHDRVCIASFSDARLATARTLLGPAVCTSLGPRGVAALRMASYSARAGTRIRLPAPCVQVPITVAGRPLCDERLITAAHARGMQVHVWTVDTRAEIEAVLALGVDGVMTDRPEVLREVLVRRGQWTGR
ncbi:glycerophosphodiester phosphodiesterase [soil metagenome]